MRRHVIAVVALGAFTSSCAASESPISADEEFEAIEDGKADNYYSNVAAEFEVSGTVDITFDPPESANDPALRADMIGRRTTAVALYLTAYVTAKLERFFTNTSYGGFSAMARNHTLAAGDVVEVSPGLVRVAFTIDIGGPKNLLAALPPLPPLPDAPPDVFQFELAMPKGAVADPENVARGAIRNFNAATHTGELERLRLSVVAEEMPADAWPQTAAMMEDGTFDITLYYGHDYNTPRSDLREAREAYDELVSFRGFTSPVANFEALTAESGAFTKSMTANGKAVAVEVRIFHSDMFKDDRKAGHDKALAELAARDVFFYNGHAGPWYGLYLSDDKPNDVAYAELATIALPDKQQIFVAQGCQTYSQYADVLYANPAKSEENLDVVTTVNFSYGVGTMGLLRNLLKTSAEGRHELVTFGAIVRELNAEYWNDQKDVFYGVMGIGGNPQVHPYGVSAKIGEACARVSDCGDPNGNVCVAPPGAADKVCGVVALERAECPAGSLLRPLAQNGIIKRWGCLP